jgi:hypothetical protein
MRKHLVLMPQRFEANLYASINHKPPKARSSRWQKDDFKETRL